MKPVEVVKLVRDSWSLAIPENRLALLQTVKQRVPEEHWELFESLVDVHVSNVQDDPDAITLMLVHGIQTDGAWQELVKAAFHDVKHIKVKSLGYDCVTPAQLAFPFRKGPIERIVRHFRDARAMEPNARIMVIAHSFGTYIISRILSHYPDIDIQRIVLCGSIIKSDYRWDLHTRHMQTGNVLNDIGTRDFYPVLATFSTIGYGGTGRKGFGNTRVVDRFFNYGHSDFFLPDNDHISKYWRPYIVDGEIVKSEWDTLKPKTNVAILMACHPWIGRTLFLGSGAALILTAVLKYAA